MTLLSRVLDMVQDTLHSRGRCMPAHLAVQFDNTASENRNQWVLEAGLHVVHSYAWHAIYAFLPRALNWSVVLG